jgi:hypothetical protein
LGVEGNRLAFGNVAIDESESLYIVITKMTKFMEAGSCNTYIFFGNQGVDRIRHIIGGNFGQANIETLCNEAIAYGENL